MRDERSSSQILFSLLPQQTVDIKGRIWRVKEWRDPYSIAIDLAAVRKRLISALDPWRKNGQDNGASVDLRASHSLEVVQLNKERGVEVELWPNTWICTQCRRLGSDRRQTCPCGGKKWGQLHFVGYHQCGHLTEPRVPACPTHRQVAITTPKSSNVRDLIFSCPICHRIVQRGLGGGRPCPGCNQTGLAFNVHRAAAVYAPHTFTMVNPARPEQLRDLYSHGGPSRCLDWILGGMAGDRPSARSESRDTFVENLVAQGLSRQAAEAAATSAAAAGHKFSGGTDQPTLNLDTERLELARDEAMDLALAVHEGRRSARKLAKDPPNDHLQTLYENRYNAALSAAGLEDLDLVDRFPVLRGAFGYSRGGGAPGDKRIVMFRGRNGSYRVYGDASETEALLLRLDPVKVIRWLARRGLFDSPIDDATQARVALLEAMTIPERGADIAEETVGSAILTLLHSYTHRLVRQLSVLAGIDRESLAEYLLPRHLASFVYAGSRGDFVLGGLQAVFETDLHILLERHLHEQTRCPLDPGCARGGGACLACLHLGEPSCTHYNRFLDRGVLFGHRGFLTMDQVGPRE